MKQAPPRAAERRRGGGAHPGSSRLLRRRGRQADAAETRHPRRATRCLAATPKFPPKSQEPPGPAAAARAP
eukprot:scaffold10117_cov111-Isochrysis_galbana.AAC.3